MPESSYTVTYNGQEPWISGVPYVSMDVEKVYAAGQVGHIRTVTLNGTYPSGDVGFITGLESAFAANFKAFSAPNVSMPCASIQEVSFDSQNFIGLTTYRIVLRDYSGFLLGVTDPVEEMNAINEQDGSVTLNHRVSAIGIATGYSSETVFSNAMSFVRSRTGVSNLVTLGWSYIQTDNSGQVFLVSQQENINRAAGTYAIIETFKFDPLRGTTNGTFKRFSVDLNSGINDDYVQVTVNGSYSVGKDVWNTGLFAQVAANELLTLAQSAVSDVNTLPLSFNIDSEEASQSRNGVTGVRTVNVRALYDNSPSSSYFDYDIEAGKDFRNGVTQFTVRGSILGQGRHARRKFENALSFYHTGLGGWSGINSHLFDIVNSGAVDFSYDSYAVNSTPQTVSVTMDSGQGIIGISATFDDAPFVSGYTSFSWTVSSDCGLNVFRPQASANQNGIYVIQDLNIINRSNINLKGDGSYPLTGTASPTALKDVLFKLRNIEGTKNIFLESETYNNSSGNVIATGFSYVYSREGNNLANLPTNGKIYVGTS